MNEKTQQGVTIIELMIIIAIIGVVTAVAVPAFSSMQQDQQLKSAVREIANTMMVARAQSIRSGNNVFVVFQGASGAAAPGQLSSDNAIDLVNDGVAASADCTIGAGEVQYTVPAQNGLTWGTTPGLAGSSVVATDTGLAPSNSRNGSTFSDATVTSTTSSASKFASWVVFQPDGIPRLMTPAACSSLGASGQGGGGIYLTNSRRDYAVVLSALGTVRVHHWVAASGWSQ